MATFCIEWKTPGEMVVSDNPIKSWQPRKTIITIWIRFNTIMSYFNFQTVPLRMSKANNIELDHDGDLWIAGGYNVLGGDSLVRK